MNDPLDDIIRIVRMIIDSFRMLYGVRTETYSGVMEHIATLSLPESVTTTVTVRREDGRPLFLSTLTGPSGDVGRLGCSENIIYAGETLVDGNYLEVMMFSPDLSTSFNLIPTGSKDVPLKEVFTFHGEYTNAIIGCDVFLRDEFVPDDTIRFVCCMDGMHRDVTVLYDGDGFHAFYDDDIEYAETVCVSGDVTALMEKAKGSVLD